MADRVLSDRYALREIVGTGGMSIVYKAWDMKQRRQVAVKLLRPEFSNDAEFVRRFNNEAHAVLQMHHTNIVDIYGLGQDGDTRYIVMEYVNGVTLKELIRQDGPIPNRRAVQMAIRILAAVDHAHKNHIIHSDIKPQNILVNADYHVKVTDFGIARATNAEPAALTEQGEQQSAPEKKNVLGSVHYFSPEQAAGQVVDEKSDLYSVGVVLYEMLTGTVPFDGESPEDIAIKHVRETPADPSTIVPTVSKALDQVLAKALAKDRADRYQTAADMATDLKRALRTPQGGFIQNAESAQQDVLPKKRYLRKSMIPAAIVLAVLLLGTVLFFTGRGLIRRWQLSVEVPSVLDEHVQDVGYLLESMGIPYTIEETVAEDVPAGVVVGQYPEAGDRLFRGDDLVLYVSTGTDTSYVPTLIGLDLQEALNRIEEYGLDWGEINYIVSDEEAGTVLAQVPDPGSYVSADRRISIVVSGESALMPDCTGLTLEDARVLLELNGFTVGKITEQTDSYAPDTIVSQSVDPNKQTLLGKAVDLVICRLNPDIAWHCNAEIQFAVQTENSEVRITIEDEDGLRTVYREQVEQGEYMVNLNLLSRQSGSHQMCVYIDGELALVKDLQFR